MPESAVPQIEVGANPDLVEVHLLGLPLDQHRVVTEHVDELRREFRLLQVQQSDDEMGDVPTRLLAFINALEGRFSAFTDSTNADLADALDRGDANVDLVYRIPPEVRAAAFDLNALLDEADEFCRSGDTLLTLQAPPTARAYRRWFLEEFVRQIDGEPPTPWSGR